MVTTAITGDGVTGVSYDTLKGYAGTLGTANWGTLTGTNVYPFPVSTKKDGSWYYPSTVWPIPGTVTATSSLSLLSDDVELTFEDAAPAPGSDPEDAEPVPENADPALLPAPAEIDPVPVPEITDPALLPEATVIDPVPEAEAVPETEAEAEPEDKSEPTP